MKRATREWVGKAEDDHITACELRESPQRLHDQVCFHCQQSAEKYLKALLEELGEAVPKTHELNDLLKRLQTHHPTLRSLRRGLLVLTDHAVDPRYPGNHTTKRQATSALRWAGRVRDTCRAILGIRAPRRRKAT